MIERNITRAMLAGLAVTTALLGFGWAGQRCARPTGRVLCDSRAAGPTLPADSLPVPLFRQATTYSCAAASLQAVLVYWGVFDGRESQLYKPLNTTEKDGTEPPAIAAAAKKYGLCAELREHGAIDDLRQALLRGDTVILDLQAWPDRPHRLPWAQTWEDGHYVVLVGMDADRAYVMDPSTSAAYAFLPLAELVSRWHDYEDRGGVRREYLQAAIFIHGKKAAAEYPGPLVRLE